MFTIPAKTSVPGSPAAARSQNPASSTPEAAPMLFVK
jgi:hypothetical protein